MESLLSNDSLLLLREISFISFKGGVKLAVAEILRGAVSLLHILLEEVQPNNKEIDKIPNKQSKLVKNLTNNLLNILL